MEVGTMVQRKSVPAADNCEISVTTEQMPDGAWAVVTSVKHYFDTTENVTDLPVPTDRFATESEAEDFGVRMGREWIARNRPRVA